MLKAVIIDGQTNAVARLKTLLGEFADEISFSGSATNTADAVKLIHATEPDVIFLEIQLVDGNGFQLLEYFPGRNFQVVFLSSTESFAIKAIKYGVLDYLLKPIDKNIFIETINRLFFIHKRSKLNLRAQLENARSTRHKISVYTNDSIIFISLKDIIFIKAEGSYSLLHIKGQKPVMASRNLKEFERTLDAECFFRVHNSYLINLDFVEKYMKADGGKIIMEDKSEIEVSRNKKDIFLAIMNSLY